MLTNVKAVVAVVGVWDLAAFGTPKGKSLLEMQYMSVLSYSLRLRRIKSSGLRQGQLLFFFLC
jgi:hypothetical protein